MQPLEGLGGTAALLLGGVVVLLIRASRLALSVAVGLAMLGAIWSFYYAYIVPEPSSLLFSMAYGGGAV